MSDIYRCLGDECDETFSHKARASAHARKHFPAVGNYGTYDFIEIIPKRERSDNGEDSDDLVNGGSE